MKIRISGIVEESVVDGPGIRFVIFTQGCVHNCEGCHNVDTHDINGGYEIDVDEIFEMIKRNPMLDGVTFSGGDPLLQVEALTGLAKKCREQGLSIYSYTGFEWEMLMRNKEKYLEFLKLNDVLVDGKFILEEKSLNLAFRGSRNQRLIDVQKTLESGTIQLKDW